MTESTLHRTGERIGRYELVHPLGRGGSGEVWEALLHGPQGFRRPVALKLLRSPGGDDEALAREARIGAWLSHPNVVATLDLGRADGITWVAMELVRGLPLAALLKRGPLPLRSVLEAGVQAAAGLAHAHQAGLVHRDVKPGNLLLDRTGLVKLADLGLARLVTTPDRPGGTPGYMPPEQLDGLEDPRADLFALGSTLYVLATGLPVLGRGAVALRNARRIEEILASPRYREAIEAVSPALAAVVRRCLRADPSERWPTADALGQALAALRSEAPQGQGLVDLLVRARPGLEPGASFASASETVPTPLTMLPERRDRFFGRTAELADLAARLERGERLVTVLGPGGTGKTRLVIEAARALRAAFPGGVVFADLSEARTAEGVCFALGEILKVPLERTDPERQIGWALRSRGPMLLLLDNFEQIVETGAPLVSGWLEQAPALAIVVTSRIALKLRGERRLALGPLPLGDAVALFLDRAHRAADAVEVELLVAELEGIPLAVELAAARTRVLEVGGIRARLADRLRLLAGGERDRPERHRSVRASLDGSWELLDPWQQAALAQLSVFEGGFDLAAAEAVVDLSGFPAAPWALDALEGLVDASLVRVDGDRFRMLELVRAYAADHLGSARDAAEVRHGAFYAQLGHRDAIEALSRPDGADRYARLREEVDNLVAGWRRAFARGDDRVGLPCALAAVTALRMRGPLSAAVAIANEALSRSSDGPVALHLASLRASTLRDVGRHDEARAVLLATIERARAAADPHHEAMAMAELGQVDHDQGRLDEADALWAAARERWERLGHPIGIATTLLGQGVAAFERGRVDLARERLQQALPIVRDAGDVRREAIALSNLGVVEAAVGHTGEAERLFERAIASFRRVGDERIAITALVNLGLIAFESGRIEIARERLRAALDLQRAIGARVGQGSALAQLGVLEMSVGDERAADAAFQDSIAIHRELDMRRSLASALTMHAVLMARTGRLEEAERCAREATTAAAEAGASRYHATALVACARLARERGDLDAARADIARARAVGPPADLYVRGEVDAEEARVLLASGDPAGARALAIRAVEHFAGRAYPRGHALATLAAAEHALGNDAAAADARQKLAGLVAQFGPRSPLAGLV